MLIQISDKAAKQIKRLKEDDNLPEDSFLRVRVEKGGCSGLSYKLDFDTVVKSDDKIFEHNGAKVVTDPMSYLHLIGSQLDFSGGLNGKGFVFTNPNAKKSCGCGNSFST